MNKYLSYYLLFLSICSCKKDANPLVPENTEPANKPVIAQSKIDSLSIKPLNFETDSVYHNLKLSLGVVSSTEEFNYGDTQAIYNTDGKLLEKIIKNDEKVMFSEPCLAKDSLIYIVAYNNKRVIVKKSGDLKFQTWEEHLIKDVLSVDFNPETNPLHRQPNQNSKEIPYTYDELYEPVKIKDNWLRVRWRNNDNWKYGWIKWKKNDILVIDFLYLC